MTKAELQKKISFDYAQVGSVRLHYATAGQGPGLIVLLHGFPEFWYSWRNQIVDLSDEFTVVAPDLRGYNLSDKPKSITDFEIPKLLDDVTGLINHFGRESAFVAGHDWGASIAWALAFRHPEYVDRVACLQVPPLPVWKKNQSLRQFMASWYMFFFQIPALPEMLLSMNDYQILTRALKTSAAEEGTFSDEVISEFKKAWSEPGALTSAVNYYRANILKRLLGGSVAAPKLSVPSMFIYGEKDHAILPSTVEGVSEMIDAEYEEVRIPEAGHWVQQEAPQAVTDALRGFFSKANS